MNYFDIEIIQTLIEESLKEQPTGDDWLDSRYNEQVHWIGHTNPYYKLFYLLAKELKPELTVELGSWQGTGASHFAAGCLEGQAITIDIHREDKAAQLRTIEAANHYPNLTYLNRWTWDAVDYVKGLNVPISILFIDAWHDYVFAKKELDLYLPLMDNSGLIICDDIIDNPGVYHDMIKFWDEMSEPKFLNNQIHPGINMGFCILKEFDNVEENRTTDNPQPTGTTKRGRPPKKS